jgi:hypothetical protein
MKLCSRCVLPLEAVPHEGDVCLACSRHDPSHEPDWSRLERELRDLLDGFRGRGAKADVMLRLTGGRDSTFGLYYLAMVAKARVLAYTWDNGFHRDGALRNIENAIRITGVEHVMDRFFDSPEENRQYFRAGLEALAAPCRVCFHSSKFGAYLAAFERDVPLIVTGHSEGQIERAGDALRIPFFLTAFAESPQLGFAYADAIGRVNQEVATKIRKRVLEPLLKHLEQTDRTKWPREIPLSYWVNWQDSGKTDELLGRTLGYAPASDTIAHTNCTLEPLRGYVEDKQGVLRIRQEMAVFVRNGTVSRAEALQQLQKLGMGGPRPAIVSEFASSVGITVDEFEAASASEKVSPVLKRWGLF